MHPGAPTRDGRVAFPVVVLFSGPGVFTLPMLTTPCLLATCVGALPLVPAPASGIVDWNPAQSLTTTATASEKIHKSFMANPVTLLAFSLE